MWAKPPVGSSNDFQRIRGLPVRAGASYPADLARKLTDLLKTPAGTQTLFDVQARALYDLGESGKGFFPIKVGGGKTLISFLAPRIVGARNPLLVLPASLLEKTEHEWRAAMTHWLAPKHLRFMSYQKLGRVAGAHDLDRLMPDMIICDEAHKIKNPRAAVTRRIARYMAAHPKTIFVPMSGTIMKSTIKDFAHLLEWSHRDTAPIPLYAHTLLEWAEALDEKTNPLSRRSPGVLLDLMPGAAVEESEDEVRTARQYFFARLNATQGIISADAADGYNGSLEIDAIEYEPNAATEANFEKLRTTWCRPDGWALTEAFQLWAVARMLILGLHYEWSPAAPEGWIAARSQWAAFVRDFLSDPASKRLNIDSELQVTNAVIAGHVSEPHGLLRAWHAMKPIFTPNPIPVWHDDTALNVCAEWLKGRTEGVVWIEHRHFARELSKRTGVAYFGAKGLDHLGNTIEAHNGPCIASIAANSTGRNLQFRHHSALYTASPSDSERWEQSLGRMHRHGQEADTVEVSALVACKEHLESVPRALESAHVKADMLGASQKLILADIVWPPTHTPRAGPRWA
jgi:hypothetical protein